MGNLTRDGITLKTLYSKLKAVWVGAVSDTGGATGTTTSSTDISSSLSVYEFPMLPITDEQYDLINGWNFDTDGTTFVYNTTNNNNSIDVTSVTQGKLVVGQIITGANVPTGAYISSLGSGTGSTGTYNLSINATATATGNTGYATTINANTKITRTASSSTGTTLTLTVSVTGIVSIGYKVLGVNIPANTTVTAIAGDGLSVTLSASIVGTASGTVYFYVANDLTYNLVRTGGWAKKSVSDNSTSEEEWMNVVSLGDIGAQGQALDLAAVGIQSLGTSTITVADTTAIAVGSYVASVGTKTGTTVVSIDSGTTFTINKPTTAAIPSGASLTFRPAPYPYYQLGINSSASATTTILHGQVNQPLKIYGDATHGNFNYTGINRTTGLATPFYAKFYLRERSSTAGYTYDEAQPSDVGVTSLTYQTYRFGLTSVLDTNIVSSDATIIGSTPYTNMSITWGATTRVINGVTKNFNVIINADTTKSGNYTSGAASPQQIYEFIQYKLRQTGYIDTGNTKLGNITRRLIEFRGDKLYTLYNSADGGVFIDNFDRQYINNYVFTDSAKTTNSFSYVSFGKLSFNTELIASNSDGEYMLFFRQINQNSTSLKYSQGNAVIAKSMTYDLGGDGTYEIKGTLLSAYALGGTVTYDFDYDSNYQAAWAPYNTYYVGDEYRRGTVWYRVNASYTSISTFGATDTGKADVISGPTVVLVAVGLAKGVYVRSSNVIASAAKIEKITTNLITLSAETENNYKLV
jgi:hypothetical protein